MAVGDGGGPEVGGPLGASGVTRLVRVPVLFTVVTEMGVAAWPLALQLRTACTASSNDSISIQENQKKIIVDIAREMRSLISHCRIIHDTERMMGPLSSLYYGF